MSDSQSLSRLNTRLLLESSRTFLEAKDPHFIARNISLVVMGKFMISRAAVAVKQENSNGKSGDDGGGSGYKFLFIRGASPYIEGEFLPDDSVSLCFQSTTERC